MNRSSITFTMLLLLSAVISCGNGQQTNNETSADSTVVAKNGQLQVIGTQLSNEQGEPLLLRGASLGWHNLWPRFYNEGAVKWLAEDWHCTVVRAAMGLEIEDNYRENPEFALQCITPVIEAAIAAGIPIFVSECGGSEANGDGRLGTEEWETYVEWMESRKISWVAWSVSDKNETCSMLLPRAEAEGNWTDDLLKPWGRLARNSIRRGL